mmetsp:Transcript_25980/g.61782  ORF Transcript_25980/g.61782 Transcript_25980/m.61782 type:complete len:90 (-) Transcript_25980:14-283(-)
MAEDPERDHREEDGQRAGGAAPAAPSLLSRQAALPRAGPDGTPFLLLLWRWRDGTASDAHEGGGALAILGTWDTPGCGDANIAVTCNSI